MCGICGVIGMEPVERAETVTRRMMQALHHRGPDEDGLLVAPAVSLGMRRLSIIDLPGGRQPVFNEAGNVAVVFNGEIYNFRDLRSVLEAHGHVFRTHSDTEVIVHAYEQWGEGCLRELRGMFSFAVWDGRATANASEPKRSAKILLARDRLGIKPLYYAWSSGALLFASEVRALISSGHVAPRLDVESLEAYLLFGSVAEPSTLVESVSSLPPGHCAEISVPVPAPELRIRPYWSFSEAAREKGDPRPMTFHAAAGQLRPLLEETVRDHLVADVPLGVFLSSGVDSTALVALASRSQANLHTFTVVFPEQRFSEAEISRQTAQRFRTDHREMLLTPDQMVAELEHAVADLDQPSMDGLNTYFVSWAARQAGLKVALSGLGGDEVFGGYSTFATVPRAAAVARLGRWIPGPLRRLTAGAAVRLSSSDAVRKAAASWRAPGELPHAYYFTRLLFTPTRVRRLLSPYLDSRASGRNGTTPKPPWRMRLEQTARGAESLDAFTGVSCFEMEAYMANTLLRDTDAVSMANSLEVRVPLLDHRLIEFVGRLPQVAKCEVGVPKALLIDALNDLLPQEVIGQRKRTFTLPWDVWLRGPLGVRVSQDLANLTPVLQPYLNPRAVRGAWQDFASGQTSWSRPWSLYVLNDWVRRHLSASAPEENPVTAAVTVSVAAGSGPGLHS